MIPHALIGAALMAAGWAVDLPEWATAAMLWRKNPARPCDVPPWPETFFAEWVHGAVEVRTAADELVSLASLGLPSAAARELASALYDRSRRLRAP